MLTTKKIWLKRDRMMRDKWINFLKENDLNHEELVDYTIGVFDDDRMIGTASAYQNIVKLVAVSKDYQEQNLLSHLMNELTHHLWDEGFTKIFIYTKPENEILFISLGFQTITQTDYVTFMERGTPNFEQYIQKLRESKIDAKKAGAIVMNANPFTLGHLHLVESALESCDHLYIFVLSDDSSEFSFEERFHLVEEGIAHLSNVTVLPTREYQVSHATFPSYFLKEQAQETVAVYQAELDATLFKNRIAPILNIQIRFMGEEPFSKVTELYNRAMKKVFKEDMDLIIIPRLQHGNQVISATKVRKAYQNGDFSLIKNFTPPTTSNYLLEKYNKESKN